MPDCFAKSGHFLLEVMVGVIITTDFKNISRSPGLPHSRNIAHSTPPKPHPLKESQGLITAPNPIRPGREGGGGARYL
jgi:hypothetical protein